MGGTGKPGRRRGSYVERHRGVALGEKLRLNMILSCDWRARSETVSQPVSPDGCQLLSLRRCPIIRASISHALNKGQGKGTNRTMSRAVFRDLGSGCAVLCCYGSTGV